MGRLNITETEGNQLIVQHSTRHFVLNFTVESTQPPHISCHFIENGHALFAAVSAPHAETAQLAQRVMSFLSAYIPLSRSTGLPLLLQRIENCAHHCHTTQC